MHTILMLCGSKLLFRVRLLKLMSYYYNYSHNHLLSLVRGFVQSPCGKINVIMTSTSSPPPPHPLNITAFQARFNAEKSKFEF